MNADCRGDAYPLGRKLWYRCILTGEVIETAAGCFPKLCPKCKRPIKETIREEPKSRTIVQVKLVHGWVTHEIQED